MKFTNISNSLLLPLLILAAAAIDSITAQWQKNDECFDVSASCITSDGVSCKDILEERTSCNKRKDLEKKLNATINVKVCNSKNNVAHNIEPDGLFLRLTGPAAIGSGDEIILGYDQTGMANPLPPTVGDENCQDFSFPNFTVDTCRSHFNFQVNVISQDAPTGTECRGFLFERNMVSACWIETNIQCKIANSMDGSMTLCQDFVPKTTNDCIQNIEYHFFWENKSRYTVDPSRLNLKQYKTFAKVAGQYLIGEDWWFQPVKPWSEVVPFVHILPSFDVCRNAIPSAQIKVSADIIPQTESEQKLVEGKYIQPCIDEFFHPPVTSIVAPVTLAPASSPPDDDNKNDNDDNDNKNNNMSKGKGGGKGSSRMRRRKRRTLVL